MQDCIATGYIVLLQVQSRGLALYSPHSEVVTLEQIVGIGMNDLHVCASLNDFEVDTCVSLAP